MDGQLRISSVETAKPGDVVVVDVRMPFGSMVVFMIKWAIATIPAAIILAGAGLGIGLAGTAIWEYAK